MKKTVTGICALIAGALFFAAFAACAAEPYDELVKGIRIPKGCYVDTGFAPNDAPRATIVCRIHGWESGHSVDLFGTPNRQAGCFILNAESNRFYARCGTASAVYCSGAYQTNVINRISMDGTALRRNGVKLLTMTSDSCASNTDTVMIPGAGARKYYLDVLSFRLENGGKLVRDMVACRKDGVLGFYDKVEQEFHPVVGSGTPEEVDMDISYEEVPGIKIPQQGHVDTGYVVKSAPKVTMASKILSVASGGDVDLFGTKTAQTGCFILNVDGGKFYLRYGVSTGTTIPAGTASVALNESFTVTCDNAILKNKVLLGSVATADFSSNTEEMSFPGVRRTGFPGVTVRTFKLEDGGKVVRDMLACRSDGRLCFYDKVEGLIYDIAGSGTPEEDVVDAPLACSWTGAGGDGKWSNPANWEDRIAPVAGSRVWVTLTDAAGTVFENDVDGLRIEAIMLSGASALTINGKALEITGNSGAVWQNDCPVVCNVAIKTATGGTFVFNKPADFNGAITSDGSGLVSFDAYTAVNGNVNFNAAISVPNGKVALNAANPTLIHCRGTVTCTEIQSSGNFYPAGTVFLYEPVVGASRLQIDYRRFVCSKADILPHGMSVDWNGGGTAGRLVLDGCDQTVNYLTGTYPSGISESAKPAGSGHELTSSESETIANHRPSTLTIAATQSAEAPVKVTGKVSLVYDAVDAACVQTFSYRTNTTYGAITVKKGKVRLDKGACFINVPRLVLGAEGVFEIGEGNGVANPMPSLTRIDLASGASLKIPEGVAISAERVFLDGKALKAEEISGASWLSGGGSLRLVTGSGNYWKEAVSGVWGAAANWTTGVPTTVIPAVIDAGFEGGAGYTVTVAEDAAPITQLTVGAEGISPITLAIDALLPLCRGWMAFDANANVTVGEGGKILCDGEKTATTTDALTLNGGASLTVENGGCVLVTNAMSNVSIAGGHGRTSRLTVEEGGEFTYQAESSGMLVSLKDLGQIDVAGTFRIWQMFDNKQIFSQAGGDVTVRGNGVFDASVSGSHTSRLTFGTGTTTFKDHAVLTFSGNASHSPYLRVAPTAAGETARFVLAGESQMLGYFGTFALGNSTVGTTLFDVCSANGFLNAGYNSGCFAYSGRLGCGYGTTVMNVSTQCAWKVDCNGLFVGVPESTTHLANPSSAELNLSGGAKVTSGAKCAISRGQSGRQRVALLNHFGIIVGENCKATAVGSRPLKGKIMLKDDGTLLETLQGHMMLGVGDAEGALEMSGGSVELCKKASSDSANNDQYYGGGDKTYPVYTTNNVFALGMYGGRGTCTISGGSFLANMKTFVGGLSKEDYHDGWNLSTNRHAGLCESLGSEGLLKVSGGSFEGKRTVCVGARGKGTLEFGPAGTFAAPEIVLSNSVETVARFVADPGSGYTGSVSADRLVIADGAKLEVDLGTYAGPKTRFRLFRTKSVEGAFRPGDVTVTGDHVDELELVQSDSGIVLRAPRGVAIIVR